MSETNPITLGNVGSKSDTFTSVPMPQVDDKSAEINGFEISTISGKNETRNENMVLHYSLSSRLARCSSNPAYMIGVVLSQPVFDFARLLTSSGLAVEFASWKVNQLFNYGCKQLSLSAKNTPQKRPSTTQGDTFRKYTISVLRGGQYLSNIVFNEIKSCIKSPINILDHLILVGFQVLSNDFYTLSNTERAGCMAYGRGLILSHEPIEHIMQEKVRFGALYLAYQLPLGSW